MVFLDQHGISHYTDLEQKITVLQDSNEQTAAALKQQNAACLIWRC